MVGMARCAVPARVVAGGTNIRATLAIEGVAPLHAARTSQRDVATTQNAVRADKTPSEISNSQLPTPNSEPRNFPARPGPFHRTGPRPARIQLAFTARETVGRQQ